MGVLVSMLAAVMAVMAAPSPAAASTGVVPEKTDGVNGVVYASVQIGDRTFIGGSFSWAGSSTGAGLPVDPTVGKRLAGARVVGEVRTAVADGVGGWYVGGDFATAGGKVRNGAARINAAGFVTAWNPLPTGSVRSIAVRGGVVYLGGSFTQIGGQARNNIAAVDASSGAPLAWNPGAGGTVSALAVSADGTTVYAGGSFNGLGGTPRANLGAVDATTGAGKPWAPGVDGAVSDIELRGSLVYAAGTFTSAGGAARANLAAIDASTGLATNLATATDGPVTAIATTADTIYVGGTFQTIGGVARANVAAVSLTTASVTSWNPGTDGPVTSLALNSTAATVHAGGTFTSAGGQRRMRAAAFETSTGALTAWDPSADAPVNAVALSGTRFYVGGAFSMLNGLPRANAAVIRSDGTVDPAWDAGPNGIVYAVAASDDGGTVYLGGAFTAVNAAPRTSLAAVTASTGTVLPSWTTGTSSSHTVRALAGSSGRLYVGGTFSRIGGRDLPRLAALSQATGVVDPAFAPRPDSTVKALTVSPDGLKVYASGFFDNIGGAPRPGIAEVSSTTGGATGFVPTVGGDGIAIDLTPDGSRLFFSTSNNRVFAFDPAVSGTPRYSVRMGGDTQAIAATATEVYIGGHFRNAQDPVRARRHLASFRVSDGAITDWITNADGSFGVWTITITPTALAIGGDFLKVAGQFQPGFGRFPGTP